MLTTSKQKTSLENQGNKSALIAISDLKLLPYIESVLKMLLNQYKGRIQIITYAATPLDIALANRHE